MDFSKTPYFDDFDPTKNFYRVLFKPGQAVQARELNQMQSILQHQVSSVGKHLFKKNSLVIPGGISLNEAADIVSITGVNDPADLVGSTITNFTGTYTSDTDLDGYITAVVLASQAATSTEPAALYVKYFKTQTDGRSTFNTSEALQTIEVSGTSTSFSVDDTVGSTIGKTAILNGGTFFTKDIFVDALQQILIVEVDNTTTTNCIIGLVVEESTIDSSVDATLLDNATGSPNQYAPGADRYKVELILTRVDTNNTLDDDNFIKMMEIENNVVVFLNNNTEYAELMKTLARRTYDANGNFIVHGLNTTVTEATNDDYIWANITRGKCYLGGYEYEQIANARIPIEKPRGAAYQEARPEEVLYSTDFPYFFVSGGSLGVPSMESLVQFTSTGDIIAALAPLTFNGATDVDDVSNEYITLDDFGATDHDLYDGDIVVYYDGGGPTTVGGLTPGNLYYVRRISATQVALATNHVATYDYSTTINLTDGAGTNHSLTKQQYFCFNPNADLITNSATHSTVNVGDNHITISNHRFQTGDPILYEVTSGTSIGELADDTIYYAIRVNDNDFRLATSYTNAVAGTAIVLTSAPSGGYDFSVKSVFDDTDATRGNSITVRNRSGRVSPRLALGSAVRYSANGETAIGGLVDGTVYYVASYSGSQIKLATTLSKALAASVGFSSSAITLDPSAAGGTTHRLFPVNIGVNNVIGYGIFKHLQYYSGDPSDGDDIYQAYIDNISMEQGFTLADIGGIKIPADNTGLTVLHKLSVVATSAASDNNISNTFKTQDLVAPANESGNYLGIVYAYEGNDLFVSKSNIQVPQSINVDSISVKTSADGTTIGTTAVLTDTFVSNWTPSYVPMLEVDTDVIKTLYDETDGSKTISYSVVQEDEFDFSTGGPTYNSSTLSSPDLFASFSTSNYFAYIPSSDVFFQLSPSTLTVNGNYYTVNPAGTDMAGESSVFIYSVVDKSGTSLSEADKTLTTVTDTITTPSASWIALSNQDVKSITKIVDGGVANVTDASWSGGTATVEITYTIAENESLNHAINDVVVIEGITPSGYNGTYTLTGVTEDSRTPDTPDTDIDTVVVSLEYTASNPGTYTSGGTVKLAPDIDNDRDITSRYLFDTGNTALITGTGRIKLKPNVTSPQGQIACKYVYNAIASGDFVSVDSYGVYNNTSNPDSTADLSYIGEIPDIVDATNRTLNPRRFLDFRARPSTYFFKAVASVVTGQSIIKLKDLNLELHASDLEGKYIIGPGYESGMVIPVGGVSFDSTTGNTHINVDVESAATVTGTFYIGLNGSSLSIADAGAGAQLYAFPKDGARITYKHTHFKPRQVLVFVDRQNDQLTVKYEDIESLEAANKLRRNPHKLPLAYVVMEPYTVDIDDVDITLFDNPVYQMLDIDNLRKRVDRNEYYTSMLLNRDINEEIRVSGIEGANTSVFGFWNEDFMDLDNQDYSDSEFSCTIYDKSYVAPSTTTRTINLELDSTSNSDTWAQTGSMLTLPYAESRAFGNDRASRFHNLNPYNAIQWYGKMTLNPSVDNWVDITNDNSQLPRPPVEEIITEITNLRAAWGTDSANGRHAITFDWRTNLGRSGRVNTDKHLSDVVRSLGKIGWNGDYAQTLINRRYNDEGVKQYLNAGRHFDQKPPSEW